MATWSQVEVERLSNELADKLCYGGATTVSEIVARDAILAKVEPVITEAMRFGIETAKLRVEYLEDEL